MFFTTRQAINVVAWQPVICSIRNFSICLPLFFLPIWCGHFYLSLPAISKSSKLIKLQLLIRPLFFACTSTFMYVPVGYFNTFLVSYNSTFFVFKLIFFGWGEVRFNRNVDLVKSKLKTCRNCKTNKVYLCFNCFYWTIKLLTQIRPT